MKKVKHKRWHHLRDTPFEVMSVILFSALTFGGAGAALAHSAGTREAKSHHIQAVLAQHSSTTHSAKPDTAQRG